MPRILAIVILSAVCFVRIGHAESEQPRRAEPAWSSKDGAPPPAGIGREAPHEDQQQQPERNQPLARGTAAWPPQVFRGLHVRVYTSGGVVLEGQVDRLQPGRIRLTRPGGSFELAQADVLRIDRVDRDSPKDGLKLGAVTGASILGLAGLLYPPQKCAPAANVCVALHKELLLIAGAAAGAAIGGGIGLVLDLRHLTRTTIYRAGAPRVEIAVTPTFAKDRLGFQGSVRF